MNAILQMPIPPGIDEAALRAALVEAESSKRSALEVLEESAGLDSTLLTIALGRLLDYRVIDADELAQLPPAFDLLPPAEAARRRCVIVHGAGGLVVVIANPFDATVRSWLEARVAAPMEWALAARGHIAAYIARHERNLRAMDAALVDAQSGPGSGDEIDNLSLTSISQDSSPIVRLVHSTIYDALRAGASDIHLETAASGLVVRYRIDGVLEKVATATGPGLSEQVISRIKVMSELDIAERRIPQDGRFKIAVEARAIDFRVSIIPSVYGEDAVLRVLDKQALTDRIHGLKLDALGFDARIVVAGCAG